MATIYVKTKEGRRAYYAGRQIPHDRFVPVPDVPFIRRLIGHWQDLEVQSSSRQTHAHAHHAPKKEG
jgi:hypothetical protein